jgi:hypothetical protein
MIYGERVRKHVERAKKEVGYDRPKLVPFMDEPEPSPSGRTAPELAYRAMARAIDGLEPRDLRKLARVVSHWKRCDESGRSVIDGCAFNVWNEQQQEERNRKADEEAKARRSRLAIV